MGEGDFQSNGNKGYRRPGDFVWTDDTNQGSNTKPASDATPSTDAEIQKQYGSPPAQNTETLTQPPVRFMEGKRNPHVPNTQGKMRLKYDEHGNLTKVEGRPHLPVRANMAGDLSQTMEANEEAVKNRKENAHKLIINGGLTPEAIAQKKADQRLEAIQQEKQIRSLMDWPPNVVNNDLMGGVGAVGAALAVPLFASGTGRAMKLGTAFALGSFATQVVQTGLNDLGDRLVCKNDHGFEWKWLSDGVVWPSTVWASAAMSEIVGQKLLAHQVFGKYSKIGSVLAGTVPFAVAFGTSTMAHSVDKFTHADDRNPTYSKWCQQAWWDSTLMTLVGGAAYFKGGFKAAVPATIGTWLAARIFNGFNPYQTPADEFDKSIVALDKVQKERSPQAMDEAIGHLREFGNFGRNGALKPAWDWQHPWEIPGNLCEQISERHKFRANGNSTAPELYKFAKLFPASEHNKGGYEGTIANAIVNFEAGQRSLKWGAIGVEMPLGDSVGQDTKVDLGGEALRKFIIARQEVDKAIKYANEHDGQDRPGDGNKPGKPINAVEEVKMLTGLRDRIDHSIAEITGSHDKLDQVIDQVKNRLWAGNNAAVNELRADTRERAKYPKLQDPARTLMLQAKLCRDAAMIDLAMAEVAIEGKIKFSPNARSESHKQVDFITSKWQPPQVVFAEVMHTLTWSRERMQKEFRVRQELIKDANSRNDLEEVRQQEEAVKRIVEAQADLKLVADRAYRLYLAAQKAGLSEAREMNEYLNHFAKGELYDISMDYSNDAVNRAAIRNGRNPAIDEQNENAAAAAAAQQPSLNVERQQAAKENAVQQEEAANQEAAQNQTQNATMQQAEIDIANRREAYAREHIQEEVRKFSEFKHRIPTPAEQDAIFNGLMDAAPEEALVPSNTAPNSTADSISQNSAAPAQPQEQTPSTSQVTQPATVPVRPIDAQKVFEARVQQFMNSNGGKAPNAAQLRMLAQGLPLGDINVSQAMNSTPAAAPLAPQQAVPVIHNAAPDR